MSDDAAQRRIQRSRAQAAAARQAQASVPRESHEVIAQAYEVAAARYEEAAARYVRTGRAVAAPSHNYAPPSDDGIKSATTTVSSEPAGPLLDRIVVLQQFVGPGEGDLRSWIVAQGEGHFADATPGGETDRRACPVGFGAPPHQVPVP